MITNPVITYCYFAFDHGKDKHTLRVRVNPSLDLEWRLYINDFDAGYYCDGQTNVLIVEHVILALSYDNVIRIYNKLLSEVKKPLP
jgi:hypothetical protein